MRHIIPISGKDSLAAAIVQTTRFPELSYEFFFNDTGCELPPVYEWLNKVERITGWKIKRIGQPLEKIIEGYNGFLPGQRSRYCTRESKIQPMERWLDGDRCTIYYGLRSDENRTGYVPLAGSKITPSYPLRPDGVWPGLDLAGVWSLLKVKNIEPPKFEWTRLIDAVAAKMPSDWQEKISEIEYSVLFSWRTRANCYLCFYQRQYELLGLLEHYPALYRRMAAFEKPASEKPKAKRKVKVSESRQCVLEVGDAEPIDSLYTWRDGYSLDELANDAEMQRRIFNRRVDEVCNYILSKYQGQLLGLVVDNEISERSCGLLCGK